MIKAYFASKRHILLTLFPQNAMLNTIPLPIKAIFPEDSDKSLSDFLDGISPELLMQFCTAFAPLINNQLDRREISKFFLERWFSTPNKDFAIEVVIPAAWNFLERVEVTVSVINSENILRLFEFSLGHKTNIVTYPNPELEIRLLKACLWLNEQIDNRDKTVSESTQHLPDNLRAPAWLMSSQFPINDIINFKESFVFSVQAYKAMKFLAYLNQNTDLHKLLTALLAKYNCATSDELLHRLLPLASPLLRPKQEGFPVFMVERNENAFAIQTFLQQNCLGKQSIDDRDVDFLSLRQQPLIEQEDGTFRVIFPKFLIERIFNGLLWGDLRAINQELKVFPSFDTFRSVLGDKFTEEILLYELLNYIFAGKGLIATGEQIKVAGFDGGIDYYFRDDMEIVLFECKDISFGAALKQSGDYKLYDKELRKKLVENERGKPKAIQQLIFNIRKILEDNYSIDPDIPEGAAISPVLVLGNSIFDVSGIQHIIQSWFQEEIAILKADGLDTSRIRPIVMITIDTLIVHQDCLAQGSVPFYWYLDIFVQHLYADKSAMPPDQKVAWMKSSFEPFSHWLANTLHELQKQGALEECRGMPNALALMLKHLIVQTD